MLIPVSGEAMSADVDKIMSATPAQIEAARKLRLDLIANKEVARLQPFSADVILTPTPMVAEP